MRSFASFLALTMIATAADKRAMTLDDLYAIKRVADPQVSPDGKQVVYQVTEITDVAANKKHTHLWLAATDGKTPPRQLTSSGKADTHPRWSPRGDKILFESNRSGKNQLWILDMVAGGEATQITNISTEASNAIWNRQGNHVAFVSAVYPEFSELPYEVSNKKNKEKMDAIEASPVKAKTFTKLFYRHWDEYVGDKRQHLFVMQVGQRDIDSPFSPDDTWRHWVRNPRDVTPGDRDAYPTSTTFSVGDDFTFTPDSKHIVFTAVPKKDESWSTNYELCRVSIDNKSKDWPSLTEGNKAADGCPRFSPDGKKLAFRAQKRAGYEADKWNLFIANCSPDGTLQGEARNVTENNAFSVEELIWSPCGGVFVLYETDGARSVALLEHPNQRGAGISGSNISSLSAGGTADRTVLMFTTATLTSPPEIGGLLVTESANQAAITALSLGQSDPNETLLSQIDRPRPESVKVKIEDGEMQMWILKPPGFDASKKYPLVYLIHGGPQGAWENGWSYRWNPQLWAAQGYVVALPNPRGSTGFGQKFVDEITGDWGGKCYRDLVAGLEHLKKQNYIDKDRIASAGASFGGYMQNWFAVNDIAKDLKCQITHCSVWNFESMWGTTDELWFDEWEHGGLPWDKPGKYAEYSPHKRAGEMAKHKVPMLIIHNDNDFRCPIGQGHELFSALQRLGVPSRFVNFPDECHWVLKPANSKHWHNEVFAWLKQYTPPGGR